MPSRCHHPRCSFQVCDLFMRETFLVTETCIGASEYPSCLIHVFIFFLTTSYWPMLYGLQPQDIVKISSWIWTDISLSDWWFQRGFSKKTLALNSEIQLKGSKSDWQESLCWKLWCYFQHGAIQMCWTILSKIPWWHGNFGKCRPTHLDFTWFGDKWPNHLKWFKGASYILKV